MANGATSSEEPRAAGDVRKAEFAELGQLPWQKILVWGLFLLVLYALRHFVFVGFVTFLLSYFVRGAVVAVARRLSPQRERPRLEQMLTAGAFALMLLAGYIGWLTLTPRVAEQTRAIVSRIRHFDVQDEFDSFLNRTIGSYLFHQRYGKPGDPAYDAAFRAFQEEGRSGEGLYRQFPAFRAGLVSGFEAHYESQELRQLQDDLLQGNDATKKFDRWFLERKAPGLFERHRDAYLSRWLNDHGTPEGTKRLAALQKEPDFTSRRDADIRQLILEDIKKDPITHAELRKEWEEATARQRWQDLRQSPEYQGRFRQYYEERRHADPQAVPFDYDVYVRLEQAYPNGKAAFTRALEDTLLPHESNETQALLRKDFELTLRHQLAKEWWAGDPLAISLRQQLRKTTPAMFTDFEASFGVLLREAVTLPVELLTALLLALYVSFDLRKLRAQLALLRQTRLRVFYEELAPEIASFGQLVGQFLQVRAVIALFNTFCTVAVLWLLGVENEVLLGLIVFVASFIPYVGVILSGIPIVVLAVVQPGGSMVLAGQAILAIAVIHLVEAHLLQPLIVARVAHVHAATAIVVLVLGEYFFGIWGLLLGVPVAVYLGRLLGLTNRVADGAPQRDARSIAFLRATWAFVKRRAAAVFRPGLAKSFRNWLLASTRGAALLVGQLRRRRRSYMNDRILPNEADAGPPEWRWFVVLGIVLLVLGLVALCHSVVATVVTLEVCGWLLLIAGAAQLIHAVWSPDWRGVFTHAIYGILGAVMGLLVVMKPLVGAEAVALLMAAYFIVGGLLLILATATASRQKSVWIDVMVDEEAITYSLEVARIRQHRFGLLVSGMIHLLLGILILGFWPPDSLWLVGASVGVSLLLSGGWWLLLGLSVRSFIRQLEHPATPEVTAPALQEKVTARAPETDGSAQDRHAAQSS